MHVQGAEGSKITKSDIRTLWKTPNGTYIKEIVQLNSKSKKQWFIHDGKFRKTSLDPLFPDF